MKSFLCESDREYIKHCATDHVCLGSAGTVTHSSTLFLTVKHHTSKPFIKDPCVGTSEIVLARLLQMCENNERKSNITFFFKA
jgi:hypothetical protein